VLEHYAARALYNIAHCLSARFHRYAVPRSLFHCCSGSRDSVLGCIRLAHGSEHVASARICSCRSRSRIFEDARLWDLGQDLFFHYLQHGNVIATRILLHQMDVHRARFVLYPASAISALAFSRKSDSGYNGPLPSLKLAVGRANGNVEIWNPQRGLWVQEAVFLGNGTNIDGLAWTQDPDEKDGAGQLIPGQQRLFSIASSASVTEWDLAAGRPKRQSTGNFSEVWCLAAQPRGIQHQDSKEEVQSQDLIAGCGDGTLVLLSTSDNDLQFKRFLARVAGKKARCMCITYQNRDRVVAGFADSMIRIYDTRNGSMLRAMSLGVSVPGAPKTGLVWQVQCLPNGDIVSGDSNGEVKFWDGKTYSMLQRIAGHDSDCLDLVASNDGRTVVSGSINGKITIFKQTNNDNGRKQWSKIAHRRVHSGEVKAMAGFDSKAMSMVVSGGGDAVPMVTPLREYGKENMRALPTLPQSPPVASAAKARLLVSWWEKSVFIWRLTKHTGDSAPDDQQSPRKLVARINLDTKTSIRCASISADGKLLAAGTNEEVKLFQLQKRAESETLGVRKLSLPTTLAKSGAHLLKFSDNGKWLAAISPESEVHVARIASVPDRPKQLHVLSRVVELDRPHRTLDRTALKDFDSTITQLAFAADGSVLVASDRAGYLDSWVLEGHEDATALAIDIAEKQSQKGSSDAGSDSDSSSDSSDDDDSTPIFYGQHWTDNPAGHLLPKLEAQPLVLTFRPQRAPDSKNGLVNGNPGVHTTRSNPHAHSHELPHDQHRLFVMTSKHQMFELDVLGGRLSDWSRKNPSSALPQHFAQIRDRVMGAVWDVSETKERLWVYGSSFVYMLNVGGDLVDKKHAQTLIKKRRKPKGGDEHGDARKRQRLESGAGGKIQETEREAGSRGVVKRYEGGVVTKLELNGRDTKRGDNTEDDDDDDDDIADTHLDRIESEGDNTVETNGDVEGQQRDRRWWCTFKYRSILGMVPLEGDPSDVDKPLEVVIVERPLWDVKTASSQD